VQGVDGPLPASVEIAVIGAGAVGVSVAYALAGAGREVLVLDRGAVGQGASAGTACLLTASHAERMANPASLLEGIRALANPAGPLAFRPTPAAIPWLARFTAASLDRGGVPEGQALMVSLCVESLAIHRAWHDEVDTGLVQVGLLNAYLTEDGLAHAHVPPGLAHERLDRAGVARIAPAVVGAIGGVFFPDDMHVDSLAFTQRIADAARARGARILEGVEVHAAAVDPGGVTLTTGRGVVRAETVVLAAGVWSAALGRQLGLHLPIAPAKGYHVEHASDGIDLAVPVFLAETRVVATPLDGRIRLAGTLELGSDPDAVDMRRVDAVARAGAEHIEGLAGRPRTAVWRGLRPMSADGLPMIGRSARSPRVVAATGHSMMGVVLAPRTAELVARVVAGDELEGRLAPLAPDRFRTLPSWRR
jgi:D-amino-acid dehydrogenase